MIGRMSSRQERIELHKSKEYKEAYKHLTAITEQANRERLKSGAGHE